MYIVITDPPPPIIFTVYKRLAIINHTLFINDAIKFGICSWLAYSMLIGCYHWLWEPKVPRCAPPETKA